MLTRILCIIGTTASGKSARAVEEALRQNGEVISVDSRQVYRGLDIGTEKITSEEMQSVPHYLIDIRDPEENYSAGDFVHDAKLLIEDISGRGKLPILAGGTHFYFDALLNGLPENIPINDTLRKTLETVSTEKLYERIQESDPERARALDPLNRRRLIRALEIIDVKGSVPPRDTSTSKYDVEWIICDVPSTELRERLHSRLRKALECGLIDEVKRIREKVGDSRLNELGLEYRIIGEFLRRERDENSLFPTLLAKLWQYARRQRAWIRKLTSDLQN